MQQFQDAREAALALRPDHPVYCFRPEVLKADASRFMGMFPGKTAYAVKTNGERNGAEDAGRSRRFGASTWPRRPSSPPCAPSRPTPSCSTCTRSRRSPTSAWRWSEYGVRVIAVDHEDEVAKLTRVVRALDIDPGAMTVFVRLHTKGHAAYELSKKFGAGPAAAVELMRRLDRTGYKVGICFHVGSQIEDPDTYERALASADWVRNRVGVPVAALDVGGGFPAEYGHDPNRKKPVMPSLDEIMARLRADIAEWGFDELPLVAEPGRVIVARAFSLIVRVLLRKGRRLYINDGIWASLSDSWTGKITLPARFLPDPAIRNRNGDAQTIVPFKVCGATCNSVDILSRPFWLPETVDTGDWVEIGHIGAYSMALRTHFNGFFPDTFVELSHALRRRRCAAGFRQPGDDGGVKGATLL